MKKVDIKILEDVYKETIVENKIYMVLMQQPYIDIINPVLYGVYATKESAKQRAVKLKKQFLHPVNIQIIKATLKP